MSRRDAQIDVANPSSKSRGSIESLDRMRGNGVQSAEVRALRGDVGRSTKVQHERAICKVGNKSTSRLSQDRCDNRVKAVNITMMQGEVHQSSQRSSERHVRAEGSQAGSYRFGVRV